MSVLPDFTLGFWNAWILIIPLIIIVIVNYFIQKKRAGLSEELTGMTTWDKRIMAIQIVNIYGIYVYSVFVPLKLGTIWFIGGMGVYTLGLIIHIIGWVTFAVSPVDQPITKWIYRISRNPIYLGEIITLLGIAMTGISWLLILLTLLYASLLHALLPSEERFCIARYGEPYQEYMKRTPKWVGLPQNH